MHAESAGIQGDGSALLSEIEERLREVLDLVDRAQRRAQCGPQMQLHYSALRRLVQEYVTLQRENQAAMEHFVSESLRLFAHCEQVYAVMYATVCEALRGSASGLNSSTPTTGGGSGGAVPGKQSHSKQVALDPQSALNIVECVDDNNNNGTTPSPLKIKLHNDNEALLKYPPSALYKVPHIEQVVHSLELYYDKECDAVHGHYAGLLDQIRQQPLLESVVTRQLQDHVALIGEAWLLVPRPVEQVEERAADDPVTLLRQQTGTLTQHLDTINAIREEQRCNCLIYEQNVHAKFMCCAQLKDNMLRPYNLTRLQQRTGVVAAIF
jgi:hypothetical protein